MVSKEQVLLFLVNVASVYGSLKRSVLYKNVPGAVSNSASGKIACAAAKADSSFVAIRIEDSTGVCEGLTWDWGSSPQYEASYSYFEKETTEEIYDPPWIIKGWTQWLLPGKFGAGGRLDIYMTPSPDAGLYYIKMINTTQMTFDLNDNFTEVVMVSMGIKKGENRVTFNKWQDRWLPLGEDTPFPFTVGVSHKISIVHNATDNLKILFDDREVVSYSHQNPEDAKQLNLKTGQQSILKINSICFKGV